MNNSKHAGVVTGRPRRHPTAAYRRAAAMAGGVDGTPWAPASYHRCWRVDEDGWRQSSVTVDVITSRGLVSNHRWRQRLRSGIHIHVFLVCGRFAPWQVGTVSSLFSRPYLVHYARALMRQACVRLSSVCTECIVAKRLTVRHRAKVTTDSL